MKTSKMLDGYPQRSCAAATLPPFARLPPIRAALPRRYAGPSLRFASLGGWPPPLRPQTRRWRGVARPSPGAGLPRPAVTPSASTAGLRVELARWRSLASASGVALGVSATRPLVADWRIRPWRKDRRGSSRRSAALFRPAGFGWGRARISPVQVAKTLVRICREVICAPMWKGCNRQIGLLSNAIVDFSLPLRQSWRGFRFQRLAPRPKVRGH